MSRLKHRQLARTAAACEADMDQAALALTWLRLNASEIAVRANSDMDDAPAGICYEPRPRGGSDANTPTETKAMRGQQDVAGQGARHLVRLLVEARDAARTAREKAEKAERVGRSLLAMEHDRAEQLVGVEQVKHDEDDTTKSAVCANPNCKRIVSQTPNDRLRGGRCDACRMYFTRNGIERPRELCAQGPDVLELQLCCSPVWTGHGEVPCGRPRHHDGRCEPADGNREQGIAAGQGAC